MWLFLAHDEVTRRVTREALLLNEEGADTTATDLTSSAAIDFDRVSGGGGTGSEDSRAMYRSYIGQTVWPPLDVCVPCHKPALSSTGEDEDDTISYIYNSTSLSSNAAAGNTDSIKGFDASECDTQERYSESKHWNLNDISLYLDHMYWDSDWKFHKNGHNYDLSMSKGVGEGVQGYNKSNLITGVIIMSLFIVGIILFSVYSCMSSTGRGVGRHKDTTICDCCGNLSTICPGAARVLLRSLGRPKRSRSGDGSGSGSNGVG